ncbi:MAG: YihY/virulence factor BrkB family protein [Bacteroidetes bacterium]|nr:YihY/virulence factor BrkB family protein [Bacteroidota bacterium]
MQVPPWIKTTWTIVNDFVDITDRRHIYLLASGIAFNQLLCLIPFVLMTISIISTFLDPSDVKQTVAVTLSQVLPTGISATSIITDVIMELSNVFNYSTVAGWIAGFILVWTASALFSSMRSGLNAIFHIPTPKIFLWYRLKDIGLTMLLVTLLSASIILSPLMSFFQTAGQDIIPLDWQPWVFGWTLRVTTIVVTALTFLAIYRIVPNRRVPWPIVLMSTGIAVIFWESARLLFAWYVLHSQNLGRFYGGYVVLASLALWLYYSALVFLLAAEIAQFIHARLKTHANPPV